MLTLAHATSMQQATGLCIGSVQETITGWG
jgi:hypothetical protein